MRYMVVERFTQGPGPVYERFAERGRMAPPGLEFVESWVDESLDRCFQVMETDDPELFDTWTAAWSDLTTFEIVPVITSREAAESGVRAILKRTRVCTDHHPCEVAAPTSCSVRPCRDHAGGVRLHRRSRLTSSRPATVVRVTERDFTIHLPHRIAAGEVRFLVDNHGPGHARADRGADARRPPTSAV